MFSELLDPARPLRASAGSGPVIAKVDYPRYNPGIAYWTQSCSLLVVVDQNG